VHGFDYDETFSPVIKHDSIQSIFALAATHDMHMIQYDVRTTFLYGELDEEIFMEQPEGYKKDEMLVCRLKRSIYGLKQAARQWNRKFDSFLTRYNLVASSADSCVYHSNGHIEIVTGLFVDDGISCSTDETKLADMLQYLRKHFEVTQGTGNYYVGFEVHRCCNNRSMFINQQWYITHIIHHFGLQKSNPAITPADPHTHLVAAAEEDTPIFAPYKEAIGCLMYVMTLIRPDIAYAVSCVAQFSERPTQVHWTTMKRILHSLQGTKDHGIMYSGTIIDNHLKGFCDADFTRDQNDRKSRIGYVFTFGNGAIAWSSKKQVCTSLSTTEAEYISACAASRDVVWLRRLLSIIGVPQSNPTPIFCDKRSAIRLVKNPEFHCHTKHFDLQYHFTWEKHESKEIDIHYIYTADQIADLLTKPFSLERTHHLHKELGVVSKDILLDY
jgi:hypothetical protein